MSVFQPSSSRWPSRMLSVLRIVAGLIFFSAGTMKLFGFPPMPPGAPPVLPMSQMWIGGVLEVVGGLAIMLGLFTRPVAFVLAGEMAVAYFQFHQPLSLFPTSNNGMPAILFCFIYLYFVFAGAGAWSLDSAIARSKGGR
ncbi:MAG TPA: DoxX family protein [Gemmatimonadales bacterium]|nr:DoxX family protein [Gemmatimonadales bacterium]